MIEAACNLLDNNVKATGLRVNNCVLTLLRGDCAILVLSRVTAEAQLTIFIYYSHNILI